VVGRHFHIGLTGQVEERGLSKHPEEILLILLLFMDVGKWKLEELL
jgi:hypothetical protein